MGLFEWIVVALLLAILFKPQKPTEYKIVDNLMTQLQMIDQRLCQCQECLSRIEASADQLATNVNAMRVDHVPK